MRFSAIQKAMYESLLNNGRLIDMYNVYYRLGGNVATAERTIKSFWYELEIMHPEARIEFTSKRDEVKFTKSNIYLWRK